MQAFRSLKSKGAAHRARFRIGSWKGKRYRHILSGIEADTHRSHNVKDLFAQKGVDRVCSTGTGNLRVR